DIQDLQTSAPVSGSFLPLPPAASQAKQYKAWSKEFTTWLATVPRFYLLNSPSTGEFSTPSETEREFRIRLGDRLAQLRDQAMQQLRAKYGPKVAAMQEKM